MAVTFNVVKTNPDNTIVLEEKNSKIPNAKPKRFVLPEANSDKFQKAREGNVTLNRWNKIITPVLSIAVGWYATGKFKSTIPGVLAGVAATCASLFGLNALDDMIQKQSDKNTNKKFDAKEIDTTEA